MNLFNGILIIIFPVAFMIAGCATQPHSICEAQPYEILLSPSKRDDTSGIRLVSISKSRKVTIRLQNGELSSARPGEMFKEKDGSSAGYTLASADPVNGKVVLNGMLCAMRSY